MAAAAVARQPCRPTPASVTDDEDEDDDHGARDAITGRQTRRPRDGIYCVAVSRA